MDLFSLEPKQRLALYTTLLGDADPTLPIGSWEWTVDTNAILWSRETTDIIGLPPGQHYTPEDLHRMVHPEDYDHFVAANERAAQVLEAPPLEYRIIRGDGQIRHMRARGRAFPGTPTRIIGTLVDRTSQVEHGESAPDITRHIKLVPATRGGGGLLVVRGAEMELSLLQYDLFETLVGKLEEDAGADREVRGYVPSVELLHNMSWDTPRPDPTNLKQVVRRTRSLLKTTELAIDSRRGFGYRLWWRTGEPRAA